MKPFLSAPGLGRRARLAMLRGLAIFAGLLGMVATLRAHDPGISTAQGELRADAFEITVGFSPLDAQQLLPPAARSERKWTQTEFETAKAALEALAPQMWDVRSGGAALAPRETHVQLAAGDSLNFRAVYPRPADAPLTVRATKLGELPPGHREFVIITDAQRKPLLKKLLSAKDDTFELGAVPAAGGAEARGGEPESPPTFWGFVRLGIAHIWTGYDHMLFLFALLVVCRSFRSIVKIISCFTLAHSITLAVATLGLINLPSRVVEPAIAASIVFVGVENLVRRGAEPRGRWAVTFAFGLIHGFGFASVLRDLGVGSGGEGIAMPLFTFNLGVEIGQVAVASLVLPIVWQLRKNEAFVRRGVPVLSAIVSAAGLYWFLERTVFA
ncbi:MAG TPA: HupE/UreJ family protein [Opitutaceae bacterium]|nr:HupE/UreJ family protein [Opitutaceae bacterium]